jgi:hypothetical protein
MVYRMVRIVRYHLLFASLRDNVGKGKYTEFKKIFIPLLVKANLMLMRRNYYLAKFHHNLYTSSLFSKTLIIFYNVWMI